MFEKKYFFLKYFSLFLGVLVTFLQPKFFNDFFTIDEFAFLLLLFGISNYLLLFDGGLSKALYPEIREKYINKYPLNNEIKDLFSIFNSVAIICFFVFTAISFLMHKLYVTNFEGFFILSFSLFITINVLISFFKNILSAIDEYFFFEKIEVFRRITNIFMILFLFIDNSFLSSILLGSLFLIGAYLKLASKICHKLEIESSSIFTFSYSSSIKVIRKYFRDARDSFIFTVNEIIIYNGGYLIFPLFLTSYEIIIYGLWMRLFTGISMLFRAITDISIHDTTRRYFEGNTLIVRKNLRNILSMNFLIIFVSIIVYFSAKDWLFDFWVGNKSIFSSSINFSLWVMIFANSIQHLSGTFLISIGNHFDFVKKISTAIMILTVLSNVTLGIFYKDISLILIILSLFYVIGSLIYLLRVKHYYAA